jgi:cytidylate kinase
MKLRTPEERRVIAESAERQMRQWTLRSEVWDKLQKEKELVQLEEHIHPFIAVSREAGAGGGEIAARVAERLGFQILGREMLDYLAETFQLPRDMLEFVDERTAHWIHDAFGFWLDKYTVSQEEYVVRLGRMVLLAVQHEESVFIGRGVQFLLPKNKGLTVRIVASEKQRIERTKRMRKVSPEEAKQFVAETDRGRKEFVRRYFHQDVADPLIYDIVLNSDRFGVEGAADLIVHTYEHLFAKAAVS